MSAASSATCAAAAVFCCRTRAREALLALLQLLTGDRANLRHVGVARERHQVLDDGAWRELTLDWPDWTSHLDHDRVARNPQRRECP
jgi:hypothetical protein